MCRICNTLFTSQSELDLHNRQTHPTAVGGTAGSMGGSVPGKRPGGGEWGGSEKPKEGGMSKPRK